MKTTVEQIRERYRMLRVGQAMYVEALSKTHGYIATRRVVAAGKKWVRLAGGVKVLESEILNWWYG